MSEEKNETEKIPGEKIADTMEIVADLAEGIIQDVTTKSETTDGAILESYANAQTASHEAEELRKEGHEE